MFCDSENFGGGARQDPSRDPERYYFDSFYDIIYLEPERQSLEVTQEESPGNTEQGSR